MGGIHFPFLFFQPTVILTCLSLHRKLHKTTLLLHVEYIGFGTVQAEAWAMLSFKWERQTRQKSQKSAINVIIHALGQTFWGDIWKCTLEKSQTSATNVIMHPLRQAIWGHIWKRTLEKSNTNVTNVTMHHLGQTIWGDIWKHTVIKSSGEKSSKWN